MAANHEQPADKQRIRKDETPGREPQDKPKRSGMDDDPILGDDAAYRDNRDDPDRKK